MTKGATQSWVDTLLYLGRGWCCNCSESRSPRSWIWRCLLGEGADGKPLFGYLELREIELGKVSSW